MGLLAARVLDALASVWPDPLAARKKRMGAAVDTPDYHRAYARMQYDTRLSSGVGGGFQLPSIVGADVLEVGCGHGGISCFLASAGARQVVGIDVNEVNLSYGRELAEDLGQRLGRPLPVRFEVMDALALALPDASMDLVLADNLFEHVDPPEQLMRELHRVLRPGGALLVPTFSAIKSKYGLHLKHGLRLPWANLVFSERTIVEALRLQAERRPELYAVYPGLRGQAERVRDVRRHKDLNDLTHAEFLRLAALVGFEVREFQVNKTTLGRVVFRVAPALEQGALGDVLSTSAGALLIKATS